MQTLPGHARPSYNWSAKENSVSLVPDIKSLDQRDLTSSLTYFLLSGGAYVFSGSDEG